MGFQGGNNSATQPGVWYAPQRVNGAVAGVSAAFELGPYVAIQAEGLYSEKGARQGDRFFVRFKYLEFPVVARFSLPDVAFCVQPFATLGFSRAREIGCFGFESWAPPTWNSAGIVPYPRTPFDCNYRVATIFDRGQIVGVGLLKARDRVRYTLELRKVHGTLDLGRNENYSSFHNEVISLLFGAAVVVK